MQTSRNPQVETVMQKSKTKYDSLLKQAKVGHETIFPFLMDNNLNNSNRFHFGFAFNARDASMILV